jgi:Arc/MetJ-type ribon-helix-helix transcriptional regulator
MSTKTVRLDEETEKALEHIVQATGLSISDVLKRGLLLLRDEISRQEGRIPYDIYAELDLGPGGYATAPSTETRRGVQEAIQRKVGR